MTIPKYIEKLLEKRNKAIKKVYDADYEISKWLDQKYIEGGYVPVRMLYTFDEDIRDSIKRTPDRNEPVCSCYHFKYGYGQCWGTKECEPCRCRGNTKYCDFYPEKRK